MWRVFVMIGALGAALAVGLGAFGAHGLEGTLSDKMMSNYQTGVQYQMFHTLGILIVGTLAAYTGDSSALTWSGWLLLFGIVIFSGSLYVMALTGMTWLGAITPIGGVSFIIGWVLLVVAVSKIKK
ncbi:DUF423 domain-containing protein [Aliibacillus thermotolerans]|uniref:DUF423 domain-containing protein n=1 Tax=Aliibacillus thermotolerans TaxID=1834418 RepID=A0ABW0U6I2_9BACI|nr:DUF423 domain-containing protein [Aliibacillus thermotolerans]MDA3129878.1 DUF423 domain-containing protein [Aliibacillus thermotolerans]